ncbi:MAG: acyloxyacyl hydrolase [Geobacteraceae bacterium]|nr:acyloxyacyl hydrolase [Geobacteraceae bacterium]
MMSFRILTVITLSLAGLALSRPAFSAETTDQKPEAVSAATEPDDYNRKIYYKNKLEFAFDAGYFPYNTKFIFDMFEGQNWERPSFFPDYTLVPLTLSLRWHLDDLGGPWFLRGNTDVTFSGNYTVIPQGPESYFVSFMTGARYNFVQPNWRIAPYIEGRVGCGFTDAQGPKGVPYSQGQDFTFTFSMGGGLRYNIDPRYSVSLGYTYMHISNLYLSDAYNYGVNVHGPNIGLNVGF